MKKSKPKFQGFTPEEIRKRFLEELDKHLLPPHQMEGMRFNADYIRSLLRNVSDRVAYDLAYDEYRLKMGDDL